MSRAKAPRRTSRGALAVAAHEGDISVLFRDYEPILLGWSEDREEVWEITLHFYRAADDTPIAENRFPLLHSTLMGWAFNGYDKARFAEGLGPRLTRRAESFYDRPPEGADWRLMRECPTYVPPGVSAGSIAAADNLDYRRWVPRSSEATS